jgi:hypothetical protein
MKLSPPPPPPPPPTCISTELLYHASKLMAECKPQPLLSEIAAARVAQSPIIAPLNARKSYIFRGPRPLAQLESKSRRDLIKSALLAATCDPTVDENQEVAALGSFPSQLLTKRLEARDDAGSPTGKEAQLQLPSNRMESSSQDNWLCMGCDDTVPSRSPISKDELAASKSKLKGTRRRTDATPGTPGKSIDDARTRKKSLKARGESPRTHGKSSSSSQYKKKGMSSPEEDCATPEITNRKKISSSPRSEKRPRKKKSPRQNKSADDINWLKADPIDVSNSAWAKLGFGPLVDPSSISDHTKTGSMDETSCQTFGDEDNSWCKLSMNMALDDDSLYKKTTGTSATKEKNRVKTIRRQLE